jgi:hypothetical protein
VSKPGLVSHSLPNLQRECGFLDGLGDKLSKIELARAKGGNTLASVYATGYRRGQEQRQGTAA